jgi:hypothetical protein
MFSPIQILNVEQDGNDGVFVTFSDGTAAGYVVEELLELRPIRMPVTPHQPTHPQST